MGLPLKAWGLIFLTVGLAVTGCARKHVSLWQSLSNPDDIRQLKSFVAEKTAQADSATNEPFPEYASFFAAASNGDWAALNYIYQQLSSQGSAHPWRHGTRWEIMNEASGGLEAFGRGDEKYVHQFGNQIIESIPPGSIYFGGTDPGRFIVTAMQESQVEGKPFFTLTQNQLVDTGYLQYLTQMYGDRLYIPTDEDLQDCFNGYYADVQRREQNNELKPGEDISVDSSGRMRVSGAVAVMGVNALLVKVICDHNTNRDCFIEESFPLDWMYPYLEPHGLIFKLNHAPLDKLSDETLLKDHNYWTKTITPMIGDWMKNDTSVADVAAFGKKVYLYHDFSGFTGDTNFVLSSYSNQSFSKLRDAIAMLYAWRAKNSDDTAEKDRMNREADLAFRQSLAMCPDSPETVFNYAQFLADQDNRADALIVAETATAFNSNPQFESLVTSLKDYGPTWNRRNESQNPLFIGK